MIMVMVMVMVMAVAHMASIAACAVAASGQTIIALAVFAPPLHSLWSATGATLARETVPMLLQSGENNRAVRFKR